MKRFQLYPLMFNDQLPLWCLLYKKYQYLELLRSVIFFLDSEVAAILSESQSGVLCDIRVSYALLYFKASNLVESLQKHEPSNLNEIKMKRNGNIFLDLIYLS